jgi:hypothetical protein
MQLGKKIARGKGRNLALKQQLAYELSNKILSDNIIAPRGLIGLLLILSMPVVAEVSNSSRS